MESMVNMGTMFYYSTAKRNRPDELGRIKLLDLSVLGEIPCALPGIGLESHPPYGDLEPSG